MAPVSGLQKISTPDGSLTAMQAGSGHGVLIVHSLLTDWTAFAPVLPWLAGRFRVTLVNLPGFHGSSPIEAGIENYGERLATAFDGFRLEPDTTIIANGFGGTAVLAMALTHGNRFGKMILSDVAAGFPPEGRQAFEVMGGKVEAEGLGSIAAIAARRVFHTAYLEAHPEAEEERRRVLLQVEPKAFVAACRSLTKAALTSSLPSITNPALVVCGELDAATPPPLCRALAEGLPDARYIELPRCGHCPPLEQPDIFIAAIKPFIEG
jgi:pimeloyl-ACP methyl ester carboxylesterase